MKEPKFVAFSTQKGGAGKSTLTVAVASYLYFVRNMNVLVVDCDYPQHSIEEMRGRDQKRIELNPAFKKSVMETVMKTGRQPWPILVTTPDEAMGKVRNLVEGGNDIDIVLFDMTGTVNNPGIVNVLNCMDTLVIPISADEMVLQSSLAYAMKVREWVTTGKSAVKDMYMLWNKVDAREKTDLYDRFDRLFLEYGLETFKTRIPESKKFSREVSLTLQRPVFRSTIIPPDKKLLKGSNLPELVEELMGLLKLETHG